MKDFKPIPTKEWERQLTIWASEGCEESRQALLVHNRAKRAARRKPGARPLDTGYSRR